MTVHKFTVTAQRMVTGMDGKERMDKDTSVHYIVAYAYEQARWHVKQNLQSAGWEITDMKHEYIEVYDIRDSCDHTTD